MQEVVEMLEEMIIIIGQRDVERVSWVWWSFVGKFIQFLQRAYNTLIINLMDVLQWSKTSLKEVFLVWFETAFRALGSAEYPSIGITPCSNLTQSTREVVSIRFTRMG